MRVAGLVNGGVSTSFAVELSAAIDRYTDVAVTLISFYDNTVEDMDPDVAALDIDIECIAADSRFDTTAYWRLRQLLSEHDILHTHHNSVGSFGRMASLATDTAVVNTEHNDHRHFSHLQNVTNMVSYPLVDALVANSASTRESLRRYERPLLARSRVEAIYNGVDLDRIAAGRTRTDVPDLSPGPTVVTAATLTAQKNLEPLVRAMALVRNRVPDANLVVVGDGPRRERLEAVAADAGVADAVTFLGYLPEREQVYAVLDRCDVFAVTSRYEGFCNAAVEAMACGLPVVASNIDVLREVFDGGGRFVDHTSPRLIAGELSRLLVDDRQRTELGETAAERARTRFSLERCARAYCRLYEEVVGG